MTEVGKHTYIYIYRKYVIATTSRDNVPPDGSIRNIITDVNANVEKSVYGSKVFLYNADNTLAAFNILSFLETPVKASCHSVG